MSAYLLDTSAILTLRDNEKGAETVANLLEKAQNNEIKCYGCFISLMEVLYRVWKDESEQAGRLAYEMVQSLPIEWIHEDKELLELSASVKAQNRMSLADAWIAASAIMSKATLVHKDPEFKMLTCPQLELPYK
jgi:ribonuclease VapC